MKELVEPVAPVLSLIFKTSYEIGCLPSKWKKANISAIYKKKDLKMIQKITALLA